CPDLEVLLCVTCSSVVIWRYVVDLELNLTFRIKDVSDWTGFDTVRLFEDAFVVVAPAAEAKEAYGPQDLGTLPMIGQHLTDQCQGRIDAGLRSHGVVPRYVFRSGDNEIGRASCRERMENPEGEEKLNKKK